MPETRYRPFPTALSDAEWAALQPLLPAPCPIGRPLKWPRRLMAEAIFYLVRTGCAWRFLPHCFPPFRPLRGLSLRGIAARWPTVYSQFRRWRRDGALRAMHDRLRELAREAQGRSAEPSAAIVDSQTVRGWDGAKRTAGRKRHTLVDAMGLVLLVHVHAADLHDRIGAQALIGRAGPGELPRLELVWADSAYAGTFARWLEAECGWRVEGPRHRQHQARRYRLEERPKGFQVIPRRWVVERILAWLSRSWRLARDYERLPETGKAMIHAAMSRIMLRRVAA